MYSLLVTITVSNFDVFEEFERKASQIMKKYDGIIERGFEIERNESGSGKELHIVQFPSKEAFDAYRTDEELQALKEMQRSAVTTMDLLVLGIQKSYQ